MSDPTVDSMISSEHDVPSLSFFTLILLYSIGRLIFVGFAAASVLILLVKACLISKVASKTNYYIYVGFFNFEKQMRKNETKRKT